MMFLTFLRAMGFKSLYNSGKDAAEKLKNVQETQGFVDEVEKLNERLGLKKKTDRALELENAASENFLDKKELAAETQEKAEKKPWWRRSLKWVISGGFGLLLGKEFLGGKEKEIVEGTVDQGLDIVTDEEKLRQTNDTFKSAIEAERSVKEVHKEVDEKWKFKKEKQEKDWFVALEKKEKKYAKYGHKDAWKEAWEKTEYEYDPETGKQTKKRNFFFRLFAFFPALIKTYAGWRSFEALKKSGAIERIKQGKEYKDRAEKKVHEAEEKFNKGMEVKKEGFKAVFSENPGALAVSQNYLKKLGKLTRNADKFSSTERANKIREIAREAVRDGTRKVGPEFSKMKGFEKYMPGVSVKSRGGLMVVEIVGKSLGAALREGAEEGGWARAGHVFKEELFDADNWKDACPVWGTIRSFERLSVDDDVPRWSKWLDFGLSAGMDVATGVGIVASLGTLSAPLLAARTAAGSAVKGGIREIAMKQLLRQGVRGGEEFAEKEFTKEARKGFTRQIVRTAGGKWSVRLNLMMTTIGEFFGDDVEEVTTEVKHEAYNTLLTPEQRYAIALEKAARSGAPLPEREAILAEEDKKQKKEITVDEEKQSAGIFSTTSQKEEEEGKGAQTKTVSLSEWQKKSKKKKQKEGKKKVISEEKIATMAA